MVDTVEELVEKLRLDPTTRDQDETRDLNTRAATIIEELCDENETLRLAPISKTAEARRDLICRLVAVAISVGFAAQIGRIIAPPPATAQAHAFDPAHFVRLCTSMLVILLGWDWYHRDLERRPLNGILRFLLDAIIVFAELSLLLSSGEPQLWAWLLWAIFVLYVPWDVLAIVDYRQDFGFDNTMIQSPVKDVGQTYWYGVRGDPDKRGPPINFIWMLYFSVVLLTMHFPDPQGTYITCLLVALGAVALWREGGYPDTGIVFAPLKLRMIMLLSVAVIALVMAVWRSY